MWEGGQQLGGIASADTCTGSAPAHLPATSQPLAASAGIKVALPCESVTGTCFLQLYCQFILALQARCGGSVRLPFAIMTSDDTHARTQALLEQHNYFGMEPGQVWKAGCVGCLIRVSDQCAWKCWDRRQGRTATLN